MVLVELAVAEQEAHYTEHQALQTLVVAVVVLDITGLLVMAVRAAQAL